MFLLDSSPFHKSDPDNSRICVLSPSRGNKAPSGVRGFVGPPTDYRMITVADCSQTMPPHAFLSHVSTSWQQQNENRCKLCSQLKRQLYFSDVFVICSLLVLSVCLQESFSDSCCTSTSSCWFTFQKSFLHRHGQTRLVKASLSGPLFTKSMKDLFIL